MGIPTLISTSTASNAASIDITSGIDSTYDEYMFVLTDMNPATDNVALQIQFNASSGSGFNETVTSTFFNAHHKEDDSDSGLEYVTGKDIAQGTAYFDIVGNQGNGSDESCAGILHLFTPSNTTYVTHFYSRMNEYERNNGVGDQFVAGYINTTSAIDEISFKFDSGNMDGVIQMYGIS
jgi:hypothetical protein